MRWSKHANFRRQIRRMFDNELLGYIKRGREIERENPRMSGALKTTHELYMKWATEELTRRQEAIGKADR